MYNVDGSSPMLTNVTFSGNSAGWRRRDGHHRQQPHADERHLQRQLGTHSGGGMYNGYSSPTLTNVTFSGNAAGVNGGGMTNEESSPQMINVIFRDNTAGENGGGIHNYSGNPVLINVTLTGNSAYRGGGMVSWDTSSPCLVNTILWGNSATQFPQIWKVPTGTLNLSYSLVQGGCPTGVNCDHLLSVDPQFVDAAGGDLRLQLHLPRHRRRG